MPSAAAGFAPDLDKYLKSLRGRPLEWAVESLISLLKRRQIRGPEPCAVATAHVLLQVVARSKWHDVDGLLDNVAQVGRQLAKAQPKELVIGNIVRRVLSLIRDEAAEDRNEASSETQSEAALTPIDSTGSAFLHRSLPSTATRQDPAGGDSSSAAPPPRPGPLTSYSTVNVPKSMSHLLSASSSSKGEAFPSPPRTSGTSTPARVTNQVSSQVHALRSEIIDGIEEIKDEISQVDDRIAAIADVQVHPGDFVLVHQPTPTVEKFLVRAASKRNFTVLIATKPPRKPGEDVQYQGLRTRLTAMGSTVINVMNCGLMAYMARVNKVILGARAVVASGNAVVDAGAAAIARAAKEHGTPVLVLAGVYKLSPVKPSRGTALVEWGTAADVVSYADAHMVRDVVVQHVVTEVVPAECIEMYITNLGTHSRDQLASLISEHYKQEDNDFHVDKTA